VQLATSQELARYWTANYDWRACQARLDALPQFTTTIDGVDKDRMIRLETQRFTAERMSARARAVDHVPMVTAPADVVDVILEAVREVATTKERGIDLEPR
jgi:hypothetical protein